MLTMTLVKKFFLKIYLENCAFNALKL